MRVPLSTSQRQVPAIWMEVQKTWRVSFFPHPTCTIKGEMLTSLKFNAELAGFAFTTANDIETRTLPLLSEAAATVAFKDDCARGLGDCCRVDAARGIDDVGLGCQATNLAAYCGWKEAGVAAAVAKCEVYEDKTSIMVVAAARDWTNILDRNYKHHAKARNMKNGQKDDAVLYNDGTAVPQLDALKNLAPKRLIDIVEAIPDPDSTADFEVLREEMRGWNMVRACSCTPAWRAPANG